MLSEQMDLISSLAKWIGPKYLKTKLYLCAVWTRSWSVFISASWLSVRSHVLIFSFSSLPFLVPSLSLGPSFPHPHIALVARITLDWGPGLALLIQTASLVCHGLSSLHQPLLREVSNLISPHLFHSFHPYSYICHKDLLTPELSELATTVDSCLLIHLPFGALSVSVSVCALASSSSVHSSIHPLQDFSVCVAPGYLQEWGRGLWRAVVSQRREGWCGSRHGLSGSYAGCHLLAALEQCKTFCHTLPNIQVLFKEHLLHCQRAREISLSFRSYAHASRFQLKSKKVLQTGHLK